MIKVALVDDQALVRGGLAMLIAASDGFEVVGEADNGAAAIALLRQTKADVVLMDIRMPVMDGLAATKELVRSGNPARILVLTTFDDDEYVFAALRAGAAGFLLKDAQPDELLAAIRAVANGDAVMAPSVTRRLLEQLVGLLPNATAVVDNRLDVLTEREREVLIEVARGATNSEICAALFMAEGTVKTHIGRLLSKLGCRDRIGLVLLAYETGLVRR